MIWVFNYLKRKEREEQVKQAIERDKLAQMNRLANGALEFFRTLDQQKLQEAIDLYKHPRRKDQWQNERYVSFGQGPASQWGYYEDFTNRSVYPERRFITCTNELESNLEKERNENLILITKAYKQQNNDLFNENAELHKEIIDLIEQKNF